MNKFLVASHANFATGAQSTIELFAGKSKNITYLAAYNDENTTLEKQLDDFFKEITEKDHVLVFTDMFGGSVNQQISLRAAKFNNVFIIAGFNLPVVLEALLSAEPITEEFVDKLIQSGRVSLQKVKLQQPTSADDDSDDDFFD